MFTTYYLLVYIPTLAGLFGTLIWPIRKKIKMDPFFPSNLFI